MVVMTGAKALRRFIGWATALSMALGLLSCGREQSASDGRGTGYHALRYYAFRAPEHARWGLLDAHGKVVVADRWSAPPIPSEDGPLVLVAEPRGWRYYRISQGKVPPTAVTLPWLMR